MPQQHFGQHRPELLFAIFACPHFQRIVTLCRIVPRTVDDGVEMRYRPFCKRLTQQQNTQKNLSAINQREEINKKKKNDNNYTNLILLVTTQQFINK